VTTYYDAQSRSIQNTVTLTTALPTETKYDVTFTFLQDPAYEAQKGVVYFYSKNVTKQEPPSAYLNKKNKLGDGYVFDPTKGAFQLFVNYTVLVPIIEDISKSERFYINLRPNKFPKSLNFTRLNIEHLSGVLPEIHRYRARDEEITVSGQVKNIKLDPSFPTRGECQVVFNVHGTTESKESLLSFTSKFTFEIEPRLLSENSMNFKVKVAELIHTSVKPNSKSNINSVVLNELIEKIVSTYIDNENTWTLFKKPIALGDYFKNVSTFEVGSQGLLIGGEPDEAPVLKSNIH
jgi:hypothetical protein